MKAFVSATALRALFVVISVYALAGTATAQTQSAWAAQDIGGPALNGVTTLASGVFTIEAAGNDVTGSSDQFHFVYQTITGDAEIVARLDGLTQVNPWTVAGLMVRGSLAANAPHAFAAITPGKGVYFRNRASVGANTSNLSGPAHTPPAWLRLVRQGALIRGFTSTDGATWTSIGSASVSLGQTVHVGMAVASRQSRTRATAVVSNVGVRAIGLPAGQQSIDIGSPAVAGDVFASSGWYSITASGAGIDGTADQFHLVYQPVTGNADVVARVASIDASTMAARGGVTIRESLAAESRHATVVLSRGHGYAFQRRTDPGGSTAHTNGGSGTAPGWVRLVRTGDLFQAYRSSDGKAWTLIASEMIPMAHTVYVGLAATSHSATSLSTSGLDNFSISASTGGNQAPAVSILSPATGTQFTLPTTVTVSAHASDPENRMLAVDFFADWTLISRATTAPYSATWSPASAGTYTLRAVAHDADGASTTSSSVSVTVHPRVNTPPAVSLATNGTTFTAPASITLTANASDADGQIARVEFFSGGTKLNTDTTAPYTFTWSGVAAGTYTLTAVAFDNDGASTTSAPIQVTVQPPPNQPPVVSLATNGTNFNAPASITLTATASDPDGQIARVEFFSGTTRINTDTTAPYAFTWSSVPGGTYTLTAVAFDNQGASTASAPIQVTVHMVSATNPNPPRYVAFVASSDHATNVTKYMLKVYAWNANPSTATPLATSDLGKPAPSSTNEIVVDRQTFFNNLATGDYLAVVTAVNSTGETPSASVAFSR